MLHSFNDFARFDAFCAHLHAAVTACRQLNPHGLEIWVKAASGLVISV